MKSDSTKTDVLEFLQKLSGTELNSFLLELFENRSKNLHPSEILNQFSKNRFTIPSQADTISLMELEISCLKLAQLSDFQVITLSPLAPFGTCSVFKTIHQNNVVSASRGTEVVSDATNVLALIIAQQQKISKKQILFKYATTHRLTRGQAFDNPAFSAHFSAFCAVTGGFDTGNSVFEIKNLNEHLHIHLAFLSKIFNRKDLSIKIYLKVENDIFLENIKKEVLILKEYDTIFEIENQPNNYYKTLQFKVFLNHKNQLINLSDGGFVDWTQQLLSNKKHRLIISGTGTELVNKIMNKLI